MKNKTLFLFVLSALSLCACGTQPGASSEPLPPSTSEVEPPESSVVSVDTSEPLDTSEAREKLATPVLTLNDDRDGLVWADIAGAVGYEVKVNDGVPYAAEAYPFEEEAGEYSVSVRALADDAEFNSDFSEPFVYTSVLTALTGVTSHQGVISWENYVGLALAYMPADNLENFQFVQGNQLTVTEFNTYFLMAVPGFNATTSTYYVYNENAVAIVVATPYNATSAQYIEDGTMDDEQLQEIWDCKKYTDSGWATTNAIVKRSDEVPNDSCEGSLAMKIWRNGTKFRFQRPIAIDKSYDTLSFFLKGSAGDTTSTAEISLAIGDEKKLADAFDVQGIYMHMSLGAIGENWTKHEISLSDEAWRINMSGVDYTVAQAVAYFAQFGLTIDSINDLMPLFDRFSFIINGVSSGNGPQVWAYAADVALLNTGRESSHEVIIPNATLLPEYAFQSAAARGRVTVEENKFNANLKVTGVGPISIEDAPVVIEGNDMTVTSEAAGMDFVLKMSTTDGGRNWSYVSATGTLASGLANAALAPMKMIEDFESYNASGVGFDKSSYDAETQQLTQNLSGLRANYFSDFYEDTTVEKKPTYVASPVGGSKWWLQGGSSYINWKEGLGIDDSNAANMMQSDWGQNERYMSIEVAKAGLGLTQGAPAIGTGFSTFSFLVKGSPVRDVKLKAFVYYRNSVTPSTQQNDRVGHSDFVTIAKDSDWQEVTLSIDPTKTVYGFFFLLNGTWGGTSNSAYTVIDNIMLRDSISTFAA